MDDQIRTQTQIAQCEFSVIDDSSDKVTTIAFAYFERIRSYIQHEDGLINSRLTWSLTIHGFLFAIFGVLASKTADIYIQAHTGSPSAEQTAPQVLVMSALFLLQILIALFGVDVAIRSEAAIAAAHEALQHIWSIALHSETLRVIPPKLLTREEYEAGPCEIPPQALLVAIKGSRILVAAGRPDEEIVTVQDVKTDGTIQVEFKKKHPANTTL